MATSTALVTVEVFRQLTDPPGIRLELHNGEVVQVTRPIHKHFKIQKRLTRILNEALGDRGEASYELAFRARPEHELRVADVGWTTRERYENIDDEDSLAGAPEIVVEVLSPSNTASEMIVKRDLCLSSGCEQFWIVDPVRRFIEISLAHGSTHVYRGDDKVALGVAFYSVDDLLGRSR